MYKKNFSRISQKILSINYVRKSKKNKESKKRLSWNSKKLKDINIRDFFRYQINTPKNKKSKK